MKLITSALNFFVPVLLSIPQCWRTILFYIFICPVISCIWIFQIVNRSSFYYFLTDLLFPKSNVCEISDDIKKDLHSSRYGLETFYPRFHCIEKGRADAPLMIFLHGFPESCWSWKYQVEKFSSDYRCIALSMPGYGHSERYGNLKAFSIKQIVAEIAELVTYLGYEKVVLVGHDWGGVIAWCFASLREDLVSKLIILSAPHPKLLIENMSYDQLLKSFYFVLFQVPFLPEIFFRYNKFSVLKDIVLKDGHLMNDKSSLNAPLSTLTLQDIQIIKHMMSLHPGTITCALNYYRNMFSMSLQDYNDIAMPVIYCKVLVIWGENDFALRPDLNTNIESVAPNSKFVCIPNASHWIQQEKSFQVNSLISEFLDR